jgi:hypothetical protein
MKLKKTNIFIVDACLIPAECELNRSLKFDSRICVYLVVAVSGEHSFFNRVTDALKLIASWRQKSFVHVFKVMLESFIDIVVSTIMPNLSVKSKTI